MQYYITELQIFQYKFGKNMGILNFPRKRVEMEEGKCRVKSAEQKSAELRVQNAELKNVGATIGRPRFL